MSEQDRSDGDSRSPSDQTLLGVAPPPLDTPPASAQRSPVFVRSGTSAADVEPPPVPRMALPSRPVAASSDAAVNSTVAPATGGQLERLRGLFGSHPSLWMLLAPALFALAAIALLRATVVHHGTKLLPSPADNAAQVNVPPARGETTAEQLARLQAQAPESLNAHELTLLADAHSDAVRAAGKALRTKLEQTPALAKDPALQAELLRRADDARTSADALAAMAVLDAPLGPDLLYEVWTRTSVRSDATDLARALVYSADVRGKASPALAVALDLRQAERCEQYKAILPKALKDGDRRSTHLLLKLTGKHGCGSKKRDDCYACLREQPDEVTATINAVKSRRSPEYGAE